MEVLDVEQMDLELPENECCDFEQCWRVNYTEQPWGIRILYLVCTIFVTYTIVQPIVIHFTGSPRDFIEKPVSKPDWVLQNPDVYYTKSLDRNSKPCEDFYAFACGNLRNRYQRESEYRFDTMAMIKKRTRISLDKFLTKPLNTSDSATLRQMKIFHQMCINKTKVETEGIEPVLTMLNEIGGWPLLTNDSEKNESWEHIVGSVNRGGFATLFPYNLLFYPDPNNSSATAMVLTPLLDPRIPRALPNEKRTIKYLEFVTYLLNATNTQRLLILDDDVKNCIDFESELEELTNSVVEDWQVYTLEGLKTKYPQIAWKTFFNNVFISSGIEVSSNDTVILSHSMYNIKVFELLNKTSSKIIRNYVVWRLVAEAIPLMPEKFQWAKAEFEERPIGSHSRHLDCVDALIEKAKVSIGYLYIKNLLDGFSKNKSHDMIKSIEGQAYRFLKNISWMDNDTNAKIIESFRNSKMMVPNPEDNIDVMETFEFQNNDTLFANYRRLAEGHRNLKYNRLKMSQAANRQFISFEYATNADSYYVPSINGTFMLAAIFQRPFFSTSQPMYLNYGGLGFTMAYAMTHELKILSVCNSQECPSFDRLQERKRCMEKLYDGYVLKQLNETGDGERTVNENIGDLIGLKLSYGAYEEFVKDSKEQSLPGLNYTPRQWFWINAATTLCSFESDVALITTILTGPHSPAEARVNVAFANTDEFSRDFACPIGSRMNPVQKCGFQ